MKITRASVVATGFTVALAFALPASAQTNNSTSGVPGYSARPAGQCWTREFGSGHDLTGGYWGPCKAASQGSPANATLISQRGGYRLTSSTLDEAKAAFRFVWTRSPATQT